MGGAVPLRPDPSLPEPALAFIKEGQQRWLKTTAIVKFLSDLAPLLRATGHCNAAAPELPTAGDMYLINKKSCRYYRRDGRNWMKNPDGKTVRERHVKLRVDGMEVCACYYAYEMHPLKPSDPPLARRCYWLLSPDELKGQADLVLVHYLVDSEEAAAAAGEAAEVSPMHKAALARFEVAARARAEARQTDAAEAAAAAAAPAAPAAPEPAAARPQALKAPVARSPFQVPAAPSPFQPQPASRPSLATAAAPSPFQAPPASRLLQAPTAAAAGPSPFQPPGPSPFLPQAPSPFQPPAPSPFLPQAPSPFRPSAPSPFQAGSVSVPMESDCSLEPYSSSEGELLQQGPFCLGEGSYGQPRSYSQGEAMAIDQAFSQGGGFMGGEGSGFGSSGGFGEQEAPPHFRRQGALGNPMEQDLHRAVAAQQATSLGALCLEAPALGMPQRTKRARLDSASEQAPPAPLPLAPQQLQELPPQQEQLGLACLQEEEEEEEEEHLLGLGSLPLPSLPELDSSLLLEGGLDFRLPELHDLTAELEQGSPAALTPPQGAPGPQSAPSAPSTTGTPQLGAGVGAAAPSLDFDDLVGYEFSLQLFSIEEYSPKEDAAEGGAMVLIAAELLVDATLMPGMPLHASFGGQEVCAELLRSGPVRCRVPPALRRDADHTVQLCLTLGDGKPVSGAVPFTYRAPAAAVPATASSGRVASRRHRGIAARQAQRAQLALQQQQQQQQAEAVAAANSGVGLQPSLGPVAGDTLAELDAEWESEEGSQLESEAELETEVASSRAAEQAAAGEEQLTDAASAPAQVQQQQPAQLGDAEPAGAQAADSQVGRAQQAQRAAAVEPLARYGAAGAAAQPAEWVHIDIGDREAFEEAPSAIRVPDQPAQTAPAQGFSRISAALLFCLMLPLWCLAAAWRGAARLAGAAASASRRAQSFRSRQPGVLAAGDLGQQVPGGAGVPLEAAEMGVRANPQQAVAVPAAYQASGRRATQQAPQTLPLVSSRELAAAMGTLSISDPGSSSGTAAGQGTPAPAGTAAAAAATAGSSSLTSLMEGEPHPKHGAAAPLGQSGLVGGQQQLGGIALGRGQRPGEAAAAELADRDL